MFFVVQYALFGVALAIPYTILSDGGLCCLVVGVALLPLSFILVGIGQWFRFGVPVVLLYLLSPILLAGLSSLLYSGGVEWAPAIHEWRYHPLWVVATAYLAYDAVSFLTGWRRYRVE